MAILSTERISSNENKNNLKTQNCPLSFRRLSDGRWAHKQSYELARYLTNNGNYIYTPNDLQYKDYEIMGYFALKPPPFQMF